MAAATAGAPAAGRLAAGVKPFEIERDAERMARTAVQLLLDKRGSGAGQYPIECSLIPRESVARAKVPA